MNRCRCIAYSFLSHGISHLLAPIAWYSRSCTKPLKPQSIILHRVSEFAGTALAVCCTRQRKHDKQVSSYPHLHTGRKILPYPYGSISYLLQHLIKIRMLPKFEFSSSDFQNCMAYQQFCLLGEVIMKIENIKFYHIREKFYHVKPTRSRRRSGRSWTGCTSASCTTSTRRKSLLCSVPRAHPDVNNATLSFALFVGTQN